jgi:hypothetical protein
MNFKNAIVVALMLICNFSCGKQSGDIHRNSLFKNVGDTIPATNDTFNIKIKLASASDSTSGRIRITKNGAPFKWIRYKGRISVDLDFNAYYLITCSKKGHVTKVVFFDTHIPEGREKEEFNDFIVDVELFKKVKGEKKDTSIPVGGVKYDSETEDFEKAKN